MTILVRDEADIIESNIRFHASQGVDCFAVMDNNSQDGTSEILERLTTEFDLHVIHQPDNNYQQAKWMTELAFYARDHLKADLVISNDADEFWMPSEGTSLKDHLRKSDSVVTINRKNMVLDHSSKKETYRFFDASYVVESPINYSTSFQRSSIHASILLARISPKVIVNPHGLIRIKGGNHRAKHLWKFLNARSEPNITVYHYPIRGYYQFEANIRNRQTLLNTTNAGMGSHYKRWVSILEEGKLLEEYESMILTEEDIKSTQRLGITILNQDIGERLRKALNASISPSTEQIISDSEALVPKAE